MKDRSPSPMRRMVSVGEKGIVGLLCWRDLGFVVGGRISVLVVVVGILGFLTCGLGFNCGSTVLDCGFECFLFVSFCLLFLPIVLEARRGIYNDELS